MHESVDTTYAVTSMLRNVLTVSMAKPAKTVETFFLNKNNSFKRGCLTELETLG